MATYSFSALSAGEAISFSADADVLQFDESVISAADIRVMASGADTRIEVVSGENAGKNILLLNTTAKDSSASCSTVRRATETTALRAAAEMTRFQAASVSTASVAPSSANADVISDFTGGEDRLQLDDAAHADLGLPGEFVGDDARFFAGAGATSGRDETDRVIYDTSTGQLYYDADGSGARASQLIATLQGTPMLSATDIAVI